MASGCLRPCSANRSPPEQRHDVEMAHTVSASIAAAPARITVEWRSGFSSFTAGLKDHRAVGLPVGIQGRRAASTFESEERNIWTCTNCGKKAEDDFDVCWNLRDSKGVWQDRKSVV